MGFRGRKLWILAVVIFGGVYVVYLHTATVNDGTCVHYTPPGPVTYTWTSKIIESAINKTSDWENSLVQRRRLLRIEDACSGINPSTAGDGQLNLGHAKASDYDVPEYNFSFCKVAKVGCTFVVQMAAVLRFGTEKARSIFNISRDAVHKQSAFKLQRTSKSETRMNRVLFARNPYSRLYSAYVDKIYLPLKYYSAISVSKNANKDNVLNYTNYTKGNAIDDNKHVSASNVTFQHFLKKIISDMLSDRYISSHWVPITTLCHPCASQNFFLVKMETYSQDMEYLLRELNVERDKYNMIVAMLHERRVETTISGLVESTLPKCRNGSTVRKDLSPLHCVRKLWVSFQIQGYISNSDLFPALLFQTLSEQQNATYIVKTILDTIALSPMTSEEGKLQRRRALVNAYRAVDVNTLLKIKELYASDFEIFGYSTEPPSL